MGLFDWLAGKKTAPPNISIKPGPETRPFGIDKPIRDCTEEDIRESNRLLYESAEAAGLIVAWQIDSGGDHRSTLFELAVDGMQAKRSEDLPPIPEELQLRCAVLPITSTALSLSEQEGPHPRNVAYLALTREELEGFCDAIYAKKTTKKETKGHCYFCGFRHNIPSEPGQSGAAHFLQHTNSLTRKVVLGEVLAADFEARTGVEGFTSQQWIEQVLRPTALGQPPAPAAVPPAQG